VLAQVGMMNAEDRSDDFAQLIRHSTFTKGKYHRVPAAALYKCQDSVTRNSFKQALTGAFSKSHSHIDRCGS